MKTRIPIDELPEKYKPLVKEIAELIDTDMLCFLNLEIDEIDYIPQSIYNEMDFFEEEEEAIKHLKDYGWETVEFINWERYIKFEPLTSHEAFNIMEAFALQLDDNEKGRPRLINALKNRKPFANFNHIVHNCHLREEWLAFKQEWLEKEVAAQLLAELESFEGNTAI